MKTYEILPCGHGTYVQKNWTVAVCPVCGKKYEVCK